MINFNNMIYILDCELLFILFHNFFITTTLIIFMDDNIADKNFIQNH